MRLVWAAVSGALMGAGLVVSGMSNPDKVLNFLDVLGPWDPSLLIVMAAASGVAFVGYRLAWRRKQPVCEATFHLPTARQVDTPLWGGALLFGLGWGLVGYCPGPAVTALWVFPQEAVPFVLAMLAGLGGRRMLAAARGTGESA